MSVRGRPRAPRHAAARRASATLLAAALWAVAGTGEEPSLLEVPFPDLPQADPSVRAQLAEARQTIEELSEPAALARPELATAYGQLGQLFMVYDLPASARAAFVNAHRLAPSEFRWLYYRGVAEQQSSRLEEAADSFARALELEPGDLPALLRLGQVELALDRRPEARQLFARALEIEPGSAAALYGLGRLEYLEQEYAAAARRFEQVLERQPEAGTVHYQVGLAYRQMGDLERARVHLARRGRQEVTFRDPLLERLVPLARGSAILVVRATRARARGDLEGAITAFRQALATDPDHGTARLALASALEEAGRPDEAMQELRELLRLDPANPTALYNLGTALGRRGERQQAVEHLRQAVRLAPRYRDAWVNLGGQLGSLGRFEEAAEALGHAIEIDPGDRQARRMRAQALSRLESVQPALEELDRLLELEPDDGEAALLRAALLERASRDAEAADAYGTLLESSSDSRTAGRAALALAELLLRQRRPDSAVSMLRRAAELLPSDPQSRLALARGFGNAGEFAAAADLYLQVLEADAGNREARFGRALALLLSRRYREARDHLETSVRQAPGDLDLLHALARLLATAPDPELRDGERALQLARQVVERQLVVDHAETVAMALAELGRFDEAIEIQQRVLGQAERLGDPGVIRRVGGRLELYRQGRAVREPWLGPG